MNAEILKRHREQVRHLQLPQGLGGGYERAMIVDSLEISLDVQVPSLIHTRSYGPRVLDRDRRRAPIHIARSINTSVCESAPN